MKKSIIKFNQNMFEDIVGGKLSNEKENVRVANKLGILIFMFLLFQFCVVIALVLKALEVS